MHGFLHFLKGYKGGCKWGMDIVGRGVCCGELQDEMHYSKNMIILDSRINIYRQEWIRLGKTNPVRLSDREADDFVL